ncbi:Oidioi.mRNA.OKI2018_I69.chr2.g7304.t1.cds [Oikopleura dioica]|uniref:Proton-coupled zinc antiporter SLC30A9, mitochondrial n=1 Tax=Oikopleura dioica TaxID=34765 RepID=A0ABN7TAG8_OIKDI|nr:Oidioi.mRNA.OKI2018_I69.chr2.g7304.t1.cds [Oikopleura dioica]
MMRRIRPPRICFLSTSRSYTTRLDYRKKLIPPVPSKNNTITLSRAKDEYGVTEEDLKDLDFFMVRSPYEDGKEIKVFLEDKVIEVGQRMAGRNVKASKNDLEKYRNRQNTRMAQQTKGQSAKVNEGDTVVIWQFCGNASIFAVKTIFAIKTGSASMLSEAIHSLVDTANSVVLYYGVYMARRQPSVDHPYGYENMRYVTSLVSGVGIFCLGAGVSVWHGATSAVFPHELIGSELQMAYLVLAGSALIDSIVLIKAMMTASEQASKENTSFWKYISEGKNPSVNVVLLEDSCAVLGCVVAGVCMGLTQITGNHLFDASGSVIIGFMLGGVASFLMTQNSRFLIGKSIPQKQVLAIQDHLELHPAIKGVYDVKATYIGPEVVRLKAEIDIDGGVIGSAYLSELDAAEVYAEFQNAGEAKLPFKRLRQIDEYLTLHINGGIDHLGKEIDNIEVSVKKAFPFVKHVDLEIL